MVVFPLVLAVGAAPGASWWMDAVVAATASGLVTSPFGERVCCGYGVDEGAQLIPLAFSSRAQRATANAS